MHGRKVRVLEARKYPTRRFSEVAGRPGEIVQIGDRERAGVRVAVQGGTVEVLKVRTEEGDKLSAADFCRIAKLSVGDTLRSTDAAPRPRAASAR